MPPRSAFSDAERQALRQYYFSQKPRPSQRALITWFHENHGRKISQSTVSESLSDRYKHLDNSLASKASYRNRFGKWPLLEQILFSWQQQLEAQGAFMSGDLLVEKARELWALLPEYASTPLPEFSHGWLDRFKSRHNIKQYTSHGELASVPVAASAEMKLLRDICRRFLAPYMYNIDETSLYWRWAVSQGLATASILGVKKDKARISLALCSNGDGSDKLPLWLIGKSKVPRALRGVNISSLGLV